MLGFIKSSTKKLKGLIDGLLDYSKSDSVLKEEQTTFEIEALQEDISGLFSFDNSLKLKIETPLERINTNRTALNQILINLVSNAIKYNDKNEVEINIKIDKNQDFYEFSVKDNGPGIPIKNQEKVFEIYKILTPTDKFGEKGNGIGLATVKKIVEKMGGSIYLESDPGTGATFHFKLKSVENEAGKLKMA